MSNGSKIRKKTVELQPAARVSRIRRDPPPVVKEKVVDVEGRDRLDAAVGILAFAFALFALGFAVASYAGWSPRQYTVHVNAAE